MGPVIFIFSDRYWLIFQKYITILFSYFLTGKIKFHSFIIIQDQLFMAALQILELIF